MPVQSAQNPDLIDPPATDATKVWSTINRINADNPTAFLKVQVAQQAGNSELVAAIVQAAAGAESEQDIAAAVEAALVRIGGLTSRNLVALNDLLAALRAMGLSESVITATINAYSVEVADAVAAGTVSVAVAAAVLSDGATTNLYG